MATLQDAKNAITGYQAPTIPQVGGNVIGAQKPPDLGVMSFLGGVGHSIASGYNAVAAQHQQPTFNQGSSPLTQQGQIDALNTQGSLLPQGQSAFNTTPSGAMTFPSSITKAASTSTKPYTQAPMGNTSLVPATRFNSRSPRSATTPSKPPPKSSRGPTSSARSAR